MKTRYKIRLAKKEDFSQLHNVLANALLNEKNLSSTCDLFELSMHSFLREKISLGNMIVIEDETQNLRMVGEVHYYHTSLQEEKAVKEINFFPASSEYCENSRENELYSWLYSEIKNRHRDVFSIKVKQPFTEPIYWLNPAFN